MSLKLLLLIILGWLLKLLLVVLVLNFFRNKFGKKKLFNADKSRSCCEVAEK